MGWCESATASIGIKIRLSDLIPQMEFDINWNLIIEMLENGYIEDENDIFNEVFQEIIYDNRMNAKELQHVQTYLINELNNKGVYDKFLLVPVKKILNTDRWGYGRSGTNSKSRQMDFDLSVNLEKYKRIEKFEIVFILAQHSG